MAKVVLTCWKKPILCYWNQEAVTGLTYGMYGGELLPIVIGGQSEDTSDWVYDGLGYSVIGEWGCIVRRTDNIIHMPYIGITRGFENPKGYG